MKFLTRINPAFLITALLLMAVAMVACTPQPALAGSCTACHKISTDAMPSGIALHMPTLDGIDHGGVGILFDMAFNSHQLALPNNDGHKPAAFTPAIAAKTSGDSPQYLIGKTTGEIKSIGLDTALIVAGVTFAPLPDH